VKKETHRDRSRSLLNLGCLRLDGGGGSGLYRLDLLNGGDDGGGFSGRHYNEMRRELVEVRIGIMDKRRKKIH